jgi:hypothetical protein
MIDHVTYEVPMEDLEHPFMATFFLQLGMYGVVPDPKIEKNWAVKWYEAGNGVKVHIVGVEGIEPVDLRLAHFCVVVPPSTYRSCEASHFREPIGEGVDRVWLKGPAGLRAEVRQEVE